MDMICTRGSASDSGWREACLVSGDIIRWERQKLLRMEFNAILTLGTAESNLLIEGIYGETLLL